jgi:hypothetical protein
MATSPQKEEEQSTSTYRSEVNKSTAGNEPVETKQGGLPVGGVSKKSAPGLVPPMSLHKPVVPDILTGPWYQKFKRYGQASPQLVSFINNGISMASTLKADFAINAVDEIDIEEDLKTYTDAGKEGEQNRKRKEKDAKLAQAQKEEQRKQQQAASRARNIANMGGSNNQGKTPPNTSQSENYQNMGGNQSDGTGEPSASDQSQYDNMTNTGGNQLDATGEASAFDQSQYDNMTNMGSNQLDATGEGSASDQSQYGNYSNMGGGNNQGKGYKAEGPYVTKNGKMRDSDITFELPEEELQKGKDKNRELRERPGVLASQYENYANMGGSNNQGKRGESADPTKEQLASSQADNYSQGFTGSAKAGDGTSHLETTAWDDFTTSFGNKDGSGVIDSIVKGYDTNVAPQVNSTIERLKPIGAPIVAIREAYNSIDQEKFKDLAELGRNPYTEAFSGPVRKLMERGSGITSLKEWRQDSLKKERYYENLSKRDLEYNYILDFWGNVTKVSTGPAGKKAKAEADAKIAQQKAALEKRSEEDPDFDYVPGKNGGIVKIRKTNDQKMEQQLNKEQQQIEAAEQKIADDKKKAEEAVAFEKRETEMQKLMDSEQALYNGASKPVTDQSQIDNITNMGGSNNQGKDVETEDNLNSEIQTAPIVEDQMTEAEKDAAAIKAKEAEGASKSDPTKRDEYGEYDWAEDTPFMDSILPFLIGFALSGGNIGFALGMANHQYGISKGQEGRRTRADGLAKRGYTPDSIDAYVMTGNRKELFMFSEEELKHQTLRKSRLENDKLAFEQRGLLSSDPVETQRIKDATAKSDLLLKEAELSKADRDNLVESGIPIEIATDLLLKKQQAEISSLNNKHKGKVKTPEEKLYNETLQLANQIKALQAQGSNGLFKGSRASNYVISAADESASLERAYVQYNKYLRTSGLLKHMRVPNPKKPGEFIYDPSKSPLHGPLGDFYKTLDQSSLTKVGLDSSLAVLDEWVADEYDDDDDDGHGATLRGLIAKQLDIMFSGNTMKSMNKNTLVARMEAKFISTNNKHADTVSQRLKQENEPYSKALASTSFGAGKTYSDSIDRDRVGKVVRHMDADNWNITKNNKISFQLSEGGFNNLTSKKGGIPEILTDPLTREQLVVGKWYTMADIIDIAMNAERGDEKTAAERRKKQVINLQTRLGDLVDHQTSQY